MTAGKVGVVTIYPYYQRMGRARSKTAAVAVAPQRRRQVGRYRRAGQSGKDHELATSKVLDDLGYRNISGELESPTDEAVLAFAEAAELEQAYAAQVLVGSMPWSTTGAVLKADFFVFDRELFPEGLIVECKFQESSGTAADKLFAFEKRLLLAEKPGIFVLDGDGFPLDVIYLLKHDIKHVDSQLKGLYRIDEFAREARTWTRERIVALYERGYFSPYYSDLLPRF